MPGKTASPEQVAEVVALREAGFTLATIAERVNLSSSTISRIVASRKARKGTATAETVKAAREQLRSQLLSKDGIAEEAAILIADDLAQARLLRARILLAAEHLTATNLHEAAILMRAAAAFSTALKNTSDMLRHSLGYDSTRDELGEDQLPTLTVQEVSGEQAEAMRNRSCAEENPLQDDAMLEEA